MPSPDTAPSASEGVSGHPPSAVAQLCERLGLDAAALNAGGGSGAEARIRHYRRALAQADGLLRAGAYEPDALRLYQSAYRELESLIAACGGDTRHRFVVIIPVADRPQHLTNILDSLLELCLAYRYGGMDTGRYRKVVAVIADDSNDRSVIARNREIADGFAARGLETIYFGAEAQRELLEATPGEERARLSPMVGTPETNGFGHKGASVTRNVAYLMAARMGREGHKDLFYFVDSDEQFKVRLSDGREVAAINYFDLLDRIFSTGEVEVLTGKVVGDPPVSPAVMAGNFLADIVRFLEDLAGESPTGPCRFHGKARAGGGDAAYHDMSDLFGFATLETGQAYVCPLGGAHDQRRCFEEFSAGLDHFFDGEHPTRSTPFEPAEGFPSVRPARTVYTGNYVCTVDALVHFIPFAALKLRMAGPVLGRLLKAELGSRFVSADLPLLHTRTIQSGERFEFRPGVERQQRQVDLSGEFERQFFGDVTLFTIRALIEQGYPGAALDRDAIQTAFDGVENALYHRYAANREVIQQRLGRARELFDSPERWWNRTAGLDGARENVHRFLANIEANFGPDSGGYRLIGEGSNRERRRRDIVDALASYPEDRGAWREVIGDGASPRPRRSP